ncbi:MAG: hypothetical protein KDD53_02390 [Bdellovibrionales bacterium]|nr:hypothetical protein [Bdellovibrionales bacterium]
MLDSQQFVPRAGSYQPSFSDREQLIRELNLDRKLPRNVGVAGDVLSHWRELMRQDTSASVLVAEQAAWRPVREYFRKRGDSLYRSVLSQDFQGEHCTDVRRLTSGGEVEAIFAVARLLREAGMGRAFGYSGEKPKVGDLIAHEILFWVSFGELLTGGIETKVLLTNAGEKDRNNWHIHPSGFLGYNTPELITAITFGKRDARTTLFAPEEDLTFGEDRRNDITLPPDKKPLRFPPHTVVTNKFYHQPDASFKIADRPALYESCPERGTNRFTVIVGTRWGEDTLPNRVELNDIGQLFLFERYAQLRNLRI